MSARTVGVDLTNPWMLIPAMLQANPGAVVALPVFAPHDPDSSLILRTKKHAQPIPPELAARITQEHAGAGNGNGSGPARLPTHIEVGRLLATIPSDLADNFRGPVSGRHVAYLVVVHREAYDAALRQAESGIVLPGQPGARSVGPLIVKP